MSLNHSQDQQKPGGLQDLDDLAAEVNAALEADQKARKPVADSLDLIANERAVALGIADYQVQAGLAAKSQQVGGLSYE